MNLLLVDDNSYRVTKLSRFLSEYVHSGALDITVVSNAMAARKELAGKYFDLLVLDIVLPNDFSDEDPDPSKSLELLLEVVHSGVLIRPGYVLGVTAFTDVRSEVSESFSQLTWSVLCADDASDEWLHKLRACIDYIQRVSSQPKVSSYDCDVLLVTALEDPEMRAIHRLPWGWGAGRPIDDVTFVCDGSFESAGRRFTVISSVAPRMGLVSMALTVGKLISMVRPRLVVMPGICAGIKGKVDLGDVVFCDLSWDYQVGKHHVDSENVSTFAIEPYAIPAQAGISARIDQLAKDASVWSEIAGAWVESVKPPRLIRAPVASGSSVLADEKVTGLIVRQQRKVAAIEMEIYAMYAAAELSCNPKPMAIGLKGVCDFADSGKDDSKQSWAAFNSAQAMRVFLERYAHELIPASV